MSGFEKSTRARVLWTNKNAAQSIPNDTITVVGGWNDPTLSTDSDPIMARAFDPTTGHFLCPIAGRYDCSVEIDFAANAAGYRQVDFFPFTGQARLDPVQSAFDTEIVVAGPTGICAVGTLLRVLVRHTAGAPLNVTFGQIAIAFLG